MSTLSAGDVLQARYANFKQKQSNDASSIENTVGNTTNNTSIELPEEIKELITGNDYWVNAKSNRYKKLIREGHLEKLLELARMAHSKHNPGQLVRESLLQSSLGTNVGVFRQTSGSSTESRAGSAAHWYQSQQVHLQTDMERCERRAVGCRCRRDQAR